MPRGALEGPARDWLEVLHPADRDRFKTLLDATVEQRRGRIAQDFRLRSEDGHYHWFHLRARPVLGSDGEVLRAVGTLLDVTEERTAEERLLHDSVHDNLTGLPNRELYLDRLKAAITRTEAEGASRPSVFMLDIDRFKQVNEGFGLAIRRLHSPHHRPPPDPPPQAARHPGALLRRPVRLPAHLGKPRRAHRSVRRVGAAHAPRSDHPRREGDIPHRLDRHRHARRQADRGRGDDEGRRNRHVPRQASWRRPYRGLPPGAPPARHRPRHAGGGPPPGPRPRGDQGPLSAHRPTRRQDDRRLRGFGPLGSPEARPHPAGRFHPDGGAHRPDHPARPLRPRPDRPAARRLAGGARPVHAALRQCQRVEPAAPPPRPDQRRKVGACPLFDQPRFAQARGDRDACDGEPGICRASADLGYASSGPDCRSTISARATRRCPICNASRSTPSRSTGPSSAEPVSATGASSSAPSSGLPTTSAWT